MKRSYLTIVALLAVAGAAQAQTPPQLAVTRVGTGSAALSSAAAAVFVDFYSTSATNQTSALTTWALPTASSGSSRSLTYSGTATSEGGLQLSADGRYLVLGGHNAAPGTAQGSGAGTLGAVNATRTIARIDSSGSIDTTTGFGNGEYANASGTSLRSVYSADGSSFYTAGQGGTGTGGVRYVTYGTVTSPSSPSVLITNNATGAVNIRRVAAFNGQLYASTNSTPTTGVSTVGSGVPVTATNPMTNLFGTGGSSYDFFFASSTVAYLTDTRATASGGGLQRYNFNGTSWVLAYTINAGLTTGLSGLTGVNLGGGNFYFGAITQDGARLVSITDNLANTSSAGAGSFVTLAIAPTNTAFRGVAVPTPGVLALMGFGGLLAARRRR